MKNQYNHPSELDTHLAVQAFQVLRTKGERCAGEFHYGGLKGSVDFDGYTVSLSDDRVSLTVFFKHRFTLKYSKQEDLAAFKQKIQSIVSGYI